GSVPRLAPPGKKVFRALIPFKRCLGAGQRKIPYQHPPLIRKIFGHSTSPLKLCIYLGQAGYKLGEIQSASIQLYGIFRQPKGKGRPRMKLTLYTDFTAVGLNDTLGDS